MGRRHLVLTASLAGADLKLGPPSCEGFMPLATLMLPLHLSREHKGKINAAALLLSCKLRPLVR